MAKGGGTPHRKNIYWKGEHCTCTEKPKWDGGHRTYFLDGVQLGWGKNISWMGRTPHITLLMEGTIGAGTTHNIERTSHLTNSSFLTSLKSIYGQVAGWVAGRFCQKI